MPDFRQNIASAAAVAVAEKARPNWKVVPEPQPVTQAVQADASSPELSTMLHKYFGAENNLQAIAPAAATSDLIAMEPINDPDRVGRKVVLVQNGQITGEQG